MLCSGLLLAALQVGVPDTIPFELYRNQIVVRVALPGDTVRMILDTGVTPSVIDLGVARRAGLLKSDQPIGNAAGAGSGQSALYAASISGGRVGRTALEDIEAVASDLARLTARLERPFLGILGYSFLRDRRVRIDYPARVVILEPDDAPSGRVLAQDSLRLLAGDIIPFVHVSVNGVPVPVSLDTGSSLVLELFPPGAEAAGVVASGPGAELRGARGAFTSATGRVDSLSLGMAGLADQQVVLSAARGSPARHGNLGNGFLQHFVLTLDYRAGRLVLSAP